MPSAGSGPRQNNRERWNDKKYFAECRPKHSAKLFFILPSAPIKSTRQRPFAEKNFAERTLPSAKGSLPSVKTLGKAAASSSDCLALVAWKRDATLMELLSVHSRSYKSEVLQIVLKSWNLWSLYPAVQQSWNGWSSTTRRSLLLHWPRRYVRRSVACVVQMLRSNSMCITIGIGYALTE